jgi:hypothetical protein
MGSGDSFTLAFENELNRNFNAYLSGSASIGYGTSIGSIKAKDPNLHRTSYLMGSVNAFVSPFKNTNKHNFRIGGGYSLVSHTKVTGHTPYGNPGRIYSFSKRTHHCFNIIAQHDVKISQKFLMGVKLSVTGNNQMGAVTNQLLVRFGMVL